MVAFSHSFEASWVLRIYDVVQKNEKSCESSNGEIEIVPEMGDRAAVNVLISKLEKTHCFEFTWINFFGFVQPHEALESSSKF